MARFVPTTVRLDEEDVRVLKRAPSTLLFESTNSKLGDESELFRDLPVKPLVRDLTHAAPPAPQST